MNEQSDKELERLFGATQVSPVAVDVDRLLKIDDVEDSAQGNQETLSGISVATRDPKRRLTSPRSWSFLIATAAGITLAFFFLPTISSNLRSGVFAQVQNRVQRIQSLSYVKVSYLLPESD